MKRQRRGFVDMSEPLTNEQLVGLSGVGPDGLPPKGSVGLADEGPKFVKAPPGALAEGGVNFILTNRPKRDPHTRAQREAAADVRHEWLTGKIDRHEAKDRLAAIEDAA